MWSRCGAVLSAVTFFLNYFEAVNPSGDGVASMAVNLTCLGFCGADDSVDPRLLASVSQVVFRANPWPWWAAWVPAGPIPATAHTSSASQRYPWVEWGVLFRDDKEGQPRFASAAWVDDLVEVNKATPMQVQLLARAVAAVGCSESA